MEEAEKRCPQGAKEGCSSPREQSQLGHPKMSGLRDILLPTMEIGLEDVYWYQKEVPEVTSIASDQLIIPGT